MAINQTVQSSTEHCTICLEEFTNQVVGIPEHCEHPFCFTCLLEWAKNDNTCPNDRQRFQYILKKRKYSSRKPYAKVDIHNDQVEIKLQEFCQACDYDDRDSPMLTCTKCKDGYHTFCLNSFNITAWVCPSCGHSHRETVNSSLLIKLAQEIIRTFSVRDQERTIHIAKPLRRLQQSTHPNVFRRTENINQTTRNIPSSSTTIRTHDNGNGPSSRSVITPREAARRIAASGIPILEDARLTALKSQEHNMAVLKRKRKQFARLPPKIPINQMPRIQRRADAPTRPRSKPKPQPSNAPFIDKLLQSQNHLHSFQNVQCQGAHINLT